MKKSLIFTIVVSSMFLFAFTSLPESFNPTTEISCQKQKRTVYAYRMAGGNWQRGKVSYSKTQYGYKPISYDFGNYRGGGRGNFLAYAKFTRLNPNNRLALKNNWTHSVNSKVGTLYMNLD